MTKDLPPELVQELSEIGIPLDTGHDHQRWMFNPTNLPIARTLALVHGHYSGVPKHSELLDEYIIRIYHEGVEPEDKDDQKY